ncbi:MAG: hydrogenobyrinic acid a,c-diamide synthase (glutamine-hydrolyzing) [Methanothrix sp.]|nr:hydrogenobyrinic acid a,c-diamide synthase (glutamine-hydrolyzing) [Methanothrix sp.]
MNKIETSGGNVHNIPAILIAGTHSGVGKTTVTLGLMAALRARGLVVQPFKVGPDFIDPSHHSAVCGRPSRNLDPFMMGEDGVRRSFCSALAGADVAVVEGVMGLYDGMDGTETGSSAEVAKILDLPVLLVINVHGMSRSAAALEKGFAEYDRGLRLAGTILNQVGSVRHLGMLKSCLERPIFAALPRDREMEMKSRHLGLVMGFEKEHDVFAMAALLEKHAAIDEILSLRAPVPPAHKEMANMEKSVRIGVAQDEAFCFYYYDNLRELERHGADLIFFSPLVDDLPDVDGLYIGGGYPELHAARLESAPARRQIKNASEDGMPIYGECGGLMYLGRAIELETGTFGMVGALPGSTIMTKRLAALGYAEAKTVGQNPIAGLGKTLRGHEFHYSRFSCDKDARFAYRLSRGKGIQDGRDGLVEHNTLGGYLHAHFFSFSVKRFIESCRDYRRK